MNEEEQNIAIAQACGWKKDDGLNCKLYHYRCWTPPGKQGQSWRFNKVVPPDYSADLNDIHEAELAVISSDRSLLSKWIIWMQTNTNRCGYMATAPQRAEAFLRTIGKWKD